MREKIQTIKTAPFPELTAVPSARATNPMFDIIIDGKINNTNYCNALFNKLFELQPSEIRNFINYQRAKAKDPDIWLNKLEKLIAENAKIFAEKDETCRLTKLYGIFEAKRETLETKSDRESKPKLHKRYINAESETRYFSFDETHSLVESMKDFQKQIIHLTKEMHTYKRADLISKNSKLKDYAEQCASLIEELKAIRKIETEFITEPKTKNTHAPGPSNTQMVIQVDGPTKILTYAFKQFMHVLKPKGTPYMKYTIETMAAFLCENFLDENGKPLELATIKRYLGKGSTDKDPNNDMTVKF